MSSPRTGEPSRGARDRAHAPNRAQRSRVAVGLLSLAASVVAVTSCSFDRGDRWVTRPGEVGAGAGCRPGELRCGERDVLERCDGGAPGAFAPEDDCAARGLVCAPALQACAACAPGTTRCDGEVLLRCDASGERFAKERACSDTSSTSTCRDGACVDLCASAAEQRSNVGCEYWAVDLDNANIDDSRNAAAQQFAVVVSNPQPDLAATVTVEQDDTLPGAPNAAIEVARTLVPPLGLRVLRLGPREVDGSPPGEYDTGTHTALTRAAYRVRSSVPIIAYQFNPLDNVNVFSNDASLLKPVEALRTGGGPSSAAYVVVGWPQTIAETDDPETNFSPGSPLSLRNFLTIVGTRDGTHVRVHTRARILAGPPLPETAPGDVLDLELGPFDVANLETGDFHADFTGSLIETDQPVVVFSGSEASDAPAWDTLGVRQCCADHLEEQLDPIRTAGTRFVATVTPNRAEAVIRAGAQLGPYPAREFFRVVAATPAGARIRTSLPSPDDELVLAARGDFADVESTRDFVLESDAPVFLGSVSPSQGASGVPFSLPGGDPSFVVLPPVEQFRRSYVFLTPDRYSFDFVRIIAPTGADVVLDGVRAADTPGCDVTEVADLAGTPSHDVYRCQLSFPVIDTSSTAERLLAPGVQNDGVHQITSDQKVSVIVDGFDKNVSYAYAAGTELREIVPE